MKYLSHDRSVPLLAKIIMRMGTRKHTNFTSPSLLIAFVLVFGLVFFSTLEASTASAHTTSGGPATLQHSHTQKALLHPAILCSGTGCNHQDPYATGCAASMYTVAVAYVDGIGRAELEYSSACQTNWDQIYGNRAEYLAGCVVRQAGPDGPSDAACYTSTQYSWINTNMLWSPRNFDTAGGCFVEPCRGGPLGQISGYYAQTGFY